RSRAATATWARADTSAKSRIAPDSRLGLMRCDSRRLGITVKPAATSHTAETLRIPDASGMARRITDQMMENWKTGGGVPLTKAPRQPARPTTTPDRAKTTTLWTGRNSPTASAPSGWWPVSTHIDTSRVCFTYQTTPLTTRQTTPAMRYTARLVENQPWR